MPLFFCRGGFSIFVLRSKRRDMLKGITWGQFSVFLLGVTGVYYFYVFGRYYRAEVLGWIKWKRARATDVKEVANDENKQEAKGESAPEATANQTELFEPVGPGDGEDELFQTMQRAIGVIRQVIAQGTENKLDRDNLLDHIRQVLGEYRQLRKTEYAETINNFLVRVCAAELSLELGDGDLARLWK